MLNSVKTLGALVGFLATALALPQPALANGTIETIVIKTNYQSSASQSTSDGNILITSDAQTGAVNIQVANKKTVTIRNFSIPAASFDEKMEKLSRWTRADAREFTDFTLNFTGMTTRASTGLFGTISLALMTSGHEGGGWVCLALIPVTAAVSIAAGGILAVNDMICTSNLASALQKAGQSVKNGNRYGLELATPLTSDEVVKKIERALQD